MGSLGELLRTFDLPLVFPEINSLQTAVRHVAHEYLNQAEDYGYSPDICGYVKADVATQLRGRGPARWARIPKPAIAVYTNACNTYIKWAEIWERMYGVPDVTHRRARQPRRGPARPGRGDRDFENDRRYVAAQIRELIPVLERVTGSALRHRPTAREPCATRTPWLAGGSGCSSSIAAGRRRSTRCPTGPSSSASRNALSRTRGRRALLQRPGRGDGIQERRTGSAPRPKRSTGSCSWACPAIRSSAASPSCSPSMGGRSCTRPTCGSPPAARTSATSTT